MGTVVWRGGAPAVAMVSEAEIDSMDGTPANTTYGITINGHTITQVGTVDAATTIAALIVKLDASTITEFAEITWAEGSNNTHLQGTSKTKGVPFVATTFSSGGTGSMDPATTGVLDAVTANEGPNDYSTEENWDTGSIPVAADDVVFEQSSIDCLYGLAQSGATVTTLTFMQSFTGTIGLPYTNAASYREYRTQYLELDATRVDIGKSGTGTSDGSGRIKINNGTVQTTVHLHNTGANLDQNVGSFIWKGTNASNVLYLNKGDASIAPYAGETAVIDTLNIGYIAVPSSDVKLSAGDGLTLATVNCDGGKSTLEDNITTVTQRDGELTIRGAATVGTFNAFGGRCFYESTGTLTTLNGKAGALDYTRDMQPRTITTLNLYSRFTLTDPHDSVTFTNAIIISEGLEIRT